MVWIMNAMKIETMITVFTSENAKGWVLEQISWLIRDKFYAFPGDEQYRGNVEYRVTISVERVE